MARFELTKSDRYLVGQAQEALEQAGRLDLADDRAMARTVGRLETVLKQLLDMLDEDES
jgi:hypothetical protein